MHCIIGIRMQNIVVNRIKLLQIINTSSVYVKSERFVCHITYKLSLMGNKSVFWMIPLLTNALYVNNLVKSLGELVFYAPC